MCSLVSGLLPEAPVERHPAQRAKSLATSKWAWRQPAAIPAAKTVKTHTSTPAHTRTTVPGAGARSLALAAPLFPPLGFRSLSLAPSATGRSLSRLSFSVVKSELSRSLCVATMVATTLRVVRQSKIGSLNRAAPLPTLPPHSLSTSSPLVSSSVVLSIVDHKDSLHHDR